jgi:Na+-transporting NADH:ubiquinone oxidoreductase subunit A
MAETKHFRIRKGLDLPIEGTPEPVIEDAPVPSRVAVMAADTVGLRPTMLVHEGDTVRRGDPLFEDKKNPGVRFTAPGAGTVTAINRGERRALQSVVIELSAEERAGGEAPAAPFESHTGKPPSALGRDAVRALLLESGQWAALRTRPFSKVPAPDSVPASIFVTAMDTNPLAPPADRFLKERADDFARGVEALAQLTDGPVHVCVAPGTALPKLPDKAVVAEFSGVHPAGTPGLHIHLLDPVHRDKTVWHIGYQDTAATGALFNTGVLDLTRVISLAGPSVKRPRLLRTRVGASTDDLTRGELADGDHRVVSGSLLSGRTAMGDVHGYLGRYHVQVSALREGREREFLGWMAPGKEKFSLFRLFLANLTPGKRFRFSTSVNGSVRAIVPFGMYDWVMPMDIIPSHLLRSLAAGDLERCEQLGCLELDEEDLALCTFVCPSKLEYGPMLRKVLDTIEKEG